MKILKQFNRNFGVIGTETELKDTNGTILCVGDWVSVYSKATLSTYNNFVVKDDVSAFIMGWRDGCDTGNINNTDNYIITKVQDHSTINEPKDLDYSFSVELNND